MAETLGREAMEREEGGKRRRLRREGPDREEGGKRRRLRREELRTGMVKDVERGRTEAKTR